MSKRHFEEMSDQDLIETMEDYERLAQQSNKESDKTPSKTRRGNKLKPGSEDIETLLTKKRSIVKIKNKDQLCCARAIVTSKARMDQPVKYKLIRQGLPIQTDRAQRLHVEAGVPEGPCGIPELQKFQDYLKEYQIKVLSVDKPHCVIFEGPPSDKKILLVKVDDHYHSCNSFAGFIGRSYFCHHCNKAYDHKARHPCLVERNIPVAFESLPVDEETETTDITRDFWF